MTWLRVDGKLPKHVKTTLLAQALKIRTREAVGLLVSFWNYVAEYHQDGDVTRCDWGVVAVLGEFPQARGTGIKEALIHAGFVDQEGRSLHCHDWDEWHGTLITRRIKDAARKAEMRKKARAEAVDMLRKSGGRPQEVQTVRNETKRNETKETDKPHSGTASPAGVRGGWVGRVYDELIQVGDCNPGHIGKALAGLHRKHGDLLAEAAGAYRRKRLAGGPEDSKYVKRGVVADFAAQAGIYVDQVKPVGEIDADQVPA
ncbi:MAG TPA: hypothetical protein PK308_00260 [Phycisphaerales bacterium]|nr:hypothetical protein [Phycisphaerales bacterium]